MRRITLKRKQPNPLFQLWLEVLHKDAVISNSTIEPMLREALSSLSKYPLPLKTGAECAILKGFNARLCAYLDRHLEEYNYYEAKLNAKPPHERKSLDKQDINETNGDEGTDLAANAITNLHVPQQLESNIGKDSESNGNQSSGTQTEVCSSRTVSNSQSPTGEKNKPRERIYRPAYRSGAYAILAALLEHMQDCPDEPALAKEKLIQMAQKHSEESFVKPKPDTFYTAWSNITRLVTKGLVDKMRKKKVMYSLTAQGILLATELMRESQNRPTVNDLIFNTPVLSSASSSQEVSGSKIETDTDSVFSNLIGSQSSNGCVTAVEMPAGSFEIILLIDKNETGGVSKKNDPTVAQFNKYPDLKHEYRSLKVGDFIWIARHKEHKEQELVLPYVIERKRMDDLGSSIKDGRFHEQKFRLRKCGLKHVIYLVENYGSNKNVGLPLSALMQALANTRVQDGFKVHMTDSLNNSARFLAMMTKRLTIEFKDKKLQGFSKEPINKHDLMTFQYFNKSSSKSKPLTVTEMFIKLILQLKGVSVEKALSITSKYSTPAALILEYAKCSQKEGEMLLANLKYGDTTRNVGPKISKAMYQLFTQKRLT